MNTDKKWVAVIVLIIIILAVFYSYNKKEVAEVKEENKVGIANPASVFCEENGGALEIINEEAGQKGMCSFTTGEKCEEWALFRGECNVAGVSNTGVYSNSKDTVSVTYRIKAGTAILNAPTQGYNYIELKRAQSGSGARYLSDDSKIEFWEHQGEGKLTVDGKEVFVGKVQE